MNELTDRRRIAHWLAMAITIVLPMRVAAETYPEKPVRIIVPFAPGGGADTVARLIGPRLAERLGRPVVIDNRAASSGVLGTEVAARAAPDGHTLLLVTSTHTVNAALAAKLPYNLRSDFTPVILITSSPFGMLLTPAVPAGNVREFIAHVRANPGKLNFGSSGPASAPHLAAESFMAATGITMAHVPYKGVAQYVAAQLGGEIQFSFGNLFSTAGHWKSGRLRLLAHGGLKRLEFIPETPTVAESVPGFEASIWYGIVAPAKTRSTVISRLQGEIAAITMSAEMRSLLTSQGNEPVASTGEAFAGIISAEITRWTALGKRLGIRIE